MKRLFSKHLAKLWPRTLGGQLVLVAVLAVLLSNGLVIAWYSLSDDHNLQSAMTERLLDRTAATAALLGELPPETRETALKAFSNNFWGDFSIRKGNFSPPEMNQEEKRLAARLKALLPASARDLPVSVRMDIALPMRPGGPPPGNRANPPPPRPRLGDRVYEVIVPVDRDNHMMAILYRPPAPFWRPQILIAAIMSAFVVSLAAAYSAQRVARPLSKLAEAAATAARGGEAPRVPEEGPEDIRNAAAAFNAMNDQVTRTLESQRQLLSAVGHDLRTPITAMRINMEFVEDEELADRLKGNLDELQALTEAVLSAARGAGGEKKRNVDLAALIDSTCADLIDLEIPVAWQGGAPAPLMCRPNEIRRALRNLIENAVAYGKRAEVSLEAGPKGYAIHIDDEGPGIPPADQARVFEPFVRLEGSRNAATGGVGLGLTLVKAIVEGHGGRVGFESRPGGFRVCLFLPYDPPR